MIHPTAVLAAGARIGSDVEIGPYAVIDSHVELGNRCRVGPHVHLTGFTRIGDETAIHAGAVVGDEPQDLHFQGGESYTEIGSGCILREYVTIHRGAKPGTKTVIGDKTLLMAFAHVGHNCQIGCNAVIANACLLAGHVEIGDRVFLSGGVMVHQFCRIGMLAMVSGAEKIFQDLPPYCMYRWEGVSSPNTVGLRRAGIQAEARKAIKQAIRLLFFSGLSRPNALLQIQEKHGQVPELQPMIAFISSTKRGLVGPCSRYDAAGMDEDVDM